MIVTIILTMLLLTIVIANGLASIAEEINHLRTR